MTVQTTSVTQSIELEAEPKAVFAIISDPRRLPQWAAPFADAVSSDGGTGWLVQKAGRIFPIRVAAHEPTGCVDFLREISPGREGGARLRVTPRPVWGSVVVMTAPVPNGGDEEVVSAVLRAELAALSRLAQVAVPESVTA
jgi:hypothetical protein